ncbi:alpha pinene synthase, chloroplastic-like [Cryptomeria japonica]|uniref:alpha pinene synthase, chloroplastic-like n=1 Tax=Cryptomeria japonica TaxID=3369 RepID=UPI0027D9EC99|nr:alpha pinene synthase, chloroplastic-like [Cryptomeria japonica]
MKKKMNKLRKVILKISTQKNKHMQDDPIDTEAEIIPDDNTGDNIDNTVGNIYVFDVDVQMFDQHEQQEEQVENKTKEKSTDEPSVNTQPNDTQTPSEKREYAEKELEILSETFRPLNDSAIHFGRSVVDLHHKLEVYEHEQVKWLFFLIIEGVLENFKERDGQFLISYIYSHEEIRLVLNLFRVSPIAFYEEKVMDEANVFATTYLKQVMSKIDDASLLQEIKFNLEYGWNTNMPILEARNYIDIYGENTSWWCMESNVPQLDFARNQYVEFYVWAAGGCIEPKYSSFRIGFAKHCSLATIMDDKYDTYETLNELKLFTNIARWDPSTIDFLPGYMKVVFITFYEMMNEMAQEAIKTQGRDTIDYSRKDWEDSLDSFMHEMVIFPL